MGHSTWLPYYFKGRVDVARAFVAGLLTPDSQMLGLKVGTITPTMAAILEYRLFEASSPSLPSPLWAGLIFR